MTCAVPRYAEAWAYAVQWSVAAMAQGLDDSGGAANPDLSDSQAQFLNAGFKPGLGMVLYNLTAGTNGVITAVTATTLTATGVTWDDGDMYRTVAITAAQIAVANQALNVTAANIKAALTSVGACNCVLGTEFYNGLLDGNDFLGKINIIETAALNVDRCIMPGQRMTPDERTHWLRITNGWLAAIRKLEIDPCAGETGSSFPVIGWGSQALTPFGAAEIIADSLVD